MKKKSNRVEFFLLLALLVASVAVLYFYFYNSISVRDDYSAPKSNAKTAVQYDQEKENLISSLSIFKKYGEWPEVPYKLSPSRGNPFAEKQAGNNP